MGNLIKAEFRKILTTKVWWALAIPTVLLAFFWSLGVGAFIDTVSSAIRDETELAEAGVRLDELPLAVIALARSINVSTIFPMIFGVLAFSAEIQRKTITTTFLTAASRVQVLLAKCVTYATWGAGFGVVIALFAVLGSLLGAGSFYPDAGSTIIIVIAGIISCVLWTLFGVGIGALFGSSVGAIVTLLVYTLVISPFLDPLLSNLATYLPGALPNGASNGLTSSTGSDVLVNSLEGLANSPIAQLLGPEAVQGVEFTMRFAAGGLGAFDWWASGLIFLGWAALLLGGGLAMIKRRDIT